MDTFGQRLSLGSAPDNNTWDDIIQSYADEVGKVLQYKGNGNPVFYSYLGRGLNGTGTGATVTGSVGGGSQRTVGSFTPDTGTPMQAGFGNSLPWLAVGALLLFAWKKK